MISGLFLTLFLVCAFIQVVYHAIFLTGFTRYKKTITRHQPPASIVVAAHDEEENLKVLLPLLRSQKYPEYEIIVVDDRSNDGTYDLLLELGREEPRFKMVKVNHRPENFNGKKYALTLGIKAAKNDIIILTDADCRPASDQWLNEMATAFDDQTQFNIGFSWYEKTKGFLNLFIRFETLYTAVQYIGLALAGRPYMGVGRNLAYRKSLFISKKGFNRHLNTTGGDDDLFVNQHATRRNTKVTIGKNSVVYSKPKTNWKSFYRQKLRHLSVGKHYKAADKMILGLFSLTQILFWLFLTILIGLRIELYIVAAGFIVRTLMLYLSFNKACKTLGVGFNLLGLIFLDIVFVFYYIFTGATAIFTKRVRWS